jgi:hypothetical protein
VRASRRALAASRRAFLDMRVFPALPLGRARERKRAVIPASRRLICWGRWPAREAIYARGFEYRHVD